MPTRTLDLLRRGTRVHTLVFAAQLARNGDRPYDVTWEGLRYGRVNREGVRGAVLFAKIGAVAAFFDGTSALAPENAKKGYALDVHTTGMPEPLLQLARRELFAGFEGSVAGKAVPVVTSLFWSMPSGELAGARPWPKLLADGAHLVESELLKTDTAVTKLCERYGLSSEQTKTVKGIFARAKDAPPNAKIVVPAADRAVLGIVPTHVTRDLLTGAGIVLE